MESQVDSGSSKQPPNNMQAEQAFLGALLSNNRVFDMVDDFLLPEHFYYPAHIRIFREARKLRARGLTADPVMLKGRFEETGMLEDVGGTAYLMQLISATLSIHNARDYAMEVYDKWQRRQLLDMAWGVVSGVRDTEAHPDPSALAGMIAAESEKIAVGTSSLTANRCSAASAMAAAIRQIEETQRSGRLPGVSTGFSCIDRRTGGLKKGLLYVLAGETGAGKTGLAQSIARSVARGDKDVQPPRPPVSTLYLAMEMTSEEMGLRDLSAITRIASDRLQIGAIDPFEQARLRQTAKDFGDPPLTYDDTMGLTPREIDIRVRQAEKEGGIDLLVVDHMHLMRPNDEDARLDRTQQLSKIVEGLLKIARDHDVPVLALAQLNRGDGDDKRPTLRRLRQCGTIEQTAHAVFFIYREDNQQPNGNEQPLTTNSLRVKTTFGGDERTAPNPDDPVSVELIWAKNRSGPPGTDDIFFHRPTTSFQEYWNK